MVFRILKKDLKRKKGMNIILLLFVILVTVFTSAGINNVLTVMNGLDNFFTVAGVGDVVAISTVDMEDKFVSTFDACPEIESYTIERVYYSTEVVFQDGDERNSQVSGLLQSPSLCKIKLFDEDNNEITSPTNGHIKISYYNYNLWNVEIGDTLTVVCNGKEYSFIVEGWFKDAFLGSQFMGSKRFLLSDTDLETILNENEGNISFGITSMIKTSEPTQVISTLSGSISNTTFYTSSTIKLSYVMDMLIAFVLLIASVCLIIVSFIVLRFSIGFTIAEEFHEIGVMKAIGIPNGKIRLIYIIKYMGIAFCGCLVGFFLSFPLIDVMLSSVSHNMVLEAENPILLSLLSTILVAGLIVLFAWFNTKKVNKSSPVDAIRNGETGERYKKKNIFHLGKSHTGTASYLALNDIFSSPKRYLTVLLSFLLCTVLVLALVITCDTLEGDGLCPLLCGKHDLFSTYSGWEEMQNQAWIQNGRSYETVLEYTERDLNNLGIPAKTSCNIIFSPSYTVNGITQTSYFIYPLNGSAKDYNYTQGSAPQNANEVAITKVKAEELGVSIGDTIVVHYSSGDREYIITGTFDILMNVGNCLCLHESDTTALDEQSSGCMGILIDFNDNPDEETIEERKQLLREYWETENVWNSAEFIESNLGSISDTLSVVKDMLLVITFAVVILVSLLMEKAFISHEKSQIAILKAIGFKNWKIILWHSLRFAFVGVIASILAGILALPLTKLCIAPIFATMGAPGVEFTVKGVSIFLIYPGVILLVTVLSACIASLGTRKITARDTASNE